MDYFDTCTVVRYLSKVVRIATSYPLSDLEIRVMVLKFDVLLMYFDSILLQCFIDLLYTLLR